MPKFEMKDFKFIGEKKGLATFRLTKELDQEINKFAKKLELSRPDTVRLILIDTIKKFTYTGKDELYCPYWDQMSEILRILKDKKMNEKLDEMPEEICQNREEIAKIIKKYS